MDTLLLNIRLSARGLRRTSPGSRYRDPRSPWESASRCLFHRRRRVSASTLPVSIRGAWSAVGRTRTDASTLSALCLLARARFAARAQALDAWSSLVCRGTVPIREGRRPRLAERSSPGALPTPGASPVVRDLRPEDDVVGAGAVRRPSQARAAIFGGDPGPSAKWSLTNQVAHTLVV